MPTLGSRVLRRAQREVIGAWAKTQPRFGVDTRSGRIVVPGSPGTGWVLSWRRDWKTQLIDQCLSDRAGLLLDIGANIGQTLLDYCDASHRAGYIGFEPSSRCVEHLRGIIAVNGLTDCQIVPAALSDRSEVLTFFARDEADPGATLIKEIDPDKPVTRSLVPSYRLDQVIATITGGAPIGLIKIDVEGAEGAVLEGMADTLARERPLVTCEVLNRVGNADAKAHRERGEQVLSQLEAARYRIQRIVKTPDTYAIAGLKDVDRFPDIESTHENALECDYLFTPSERPFQLR